MVIIPLILAGGSGTRLWPLSRELFPKQLLNFTGSHSMLQNTILRLDGIKSLNAPIVVCNEEHRFMVAEQLRAINVKPLSIILEPAGRNTAPAIAVGAIKALDIFSNKNGKNGQTNSLDDLLLDDLLLLVLPADHIINNIENFHQAISLGVEYADEHLITFGIVPDAPETGYGYIKRGKYLNKGCNDEVCQIERFVEKPDINTAKSYIESGQFFWNSGMFMFKASQILNELENYEQNMVKVCRDSVDNGTEDLDFFRLNRQMFEMSRSESIDYAVMEKTDKGVIIPLSAGWNDLGSWDALWQTGNRDANQNVIRGDVLTFDVKNSYLHSQSRLIAAVGLEDHVIVETKDALLVAHRDRVQDVKKLVAQLKDRNRDEAVSHSKVFRPWGSYETIDIDRRFQVKRITVKPGSKLSLQKHYHRAEHWTVVSGTAIVTKGDDEIMLTENESTYIPLGTLHRLENPGKIPLELIEVQSGSYLGEDDIVRFDDIYGR
ncbi:MAG: mannose-1-phosphate guanylyltransferase/mannose-6-phosphate isomerase [Desulfamplus sp.]|nr:mannose-1-phosphate guanylyltransferase/mannose-6-phosphate isomerase [Desulfamplus sp.]